MRQEDHSKLKASLSYIVSSRPGLYRKQSKLTNLLKHYLYKKESKTQSSSVRERNDQTVERKTLLDLQWLLHKMGKAIPRH